MKRLSEFELTKKEANKMIHDTEKRIVKAIKEHDWSRAASLSSYVDGMRQMLVIFEMLKIK